MELAPTAWPEHTDDLQSIIYGQSVLQHYADSPVVATAAPLNADQDAVTINELVAQNPLNPAKTPFSLDLCAKLWRQMLPDPASETVLLPELKMQLLRQVKLYIDQSFRVLQSSALAPIADRPENLVAEPTNRDEEETTGHKPELSAPASKPLSLTDSAASSTTSPELTDDIPPASDSTSKNDSSPSEPAEKADSRDTSGPDADIPNTAEKEANDGASERLARRKSRTRRSRRSSPEYETALPLKNANPGDSHLTENTPENTPEGTNENAEDSIDRGAGAETNDSELSNKNTKPAAAVEPASLVVSPKREAPSPDQSLEATVTSLIENPKFSFFVDFPPPTTAIKTEPVCLTALLQAVREHELTSPLQIQLELYRMVANAVIAEQILPADARMLASIIEAVFDIGQIPTMAPQPKRRRR